MRLRIIFAWALLAFSIAGWPLSALLWASDEPQFILGLSWVAIILTALNILLTEDVRRQEDDK